MGAVVCLGIADLDVIQRVDGPPPWGFKAVATSTELAAGGPATNAAVTAARLLGEAVLLTALGASTGADLVRADLARHRVRAIDLAAPAPTEQVAAPRGTAGDTGQPGWQLPVSSCLVGPDGERTVVCAGATASNVELTGAAPEALAGARVLLLDGHHPVAAAQALDTRPPGCLAVLDAGSVKAHTQAWLPRLDVLAGSADYAAGLGLDPAGAVAHALDHGCGAALITAGAGDVVWAERDAVVRRATPPRVQARDTLGAGDAFHGALAAGLARGLALGAAVELACEVAATRVARVGAREWLAHVAPLTG